MRRAIQGEITVFSGYICLDKNCVKVFLTECLENANNKAIGKENGFKRDCIFFNIVGSPWASWSLFSKLLF